MKLWAIVGVGMFVSILMWGIERFGGTKVDLTQGSGICTLLKANEGISACTRAIESGMYTGSGLARNYGNRGVKYAETGDLDRAIADYNKALEIVTKLVTIIPNHSVAYGRMGEYDRAIADFNRWIEINWRDAESHNNRGLMYRNKGDLEFVMADFGKAIEFDPKFVTAYNNRGSGYFAKGEHDRAIVDFSQAIAINPNYANAYNNRARCMSLRVISSVASWITTRQSRLIRNL